MGYRQYPYDAQEKRFVPNGNYADELANIAIKNVEMIKAYNETLFLFELKNGEFYVLHCKLSMEDDSDNEEGIFEVRFNGQMIVKAKCSGSKAFTPDLTIRENDTDISVYGLLAPALIEFRLIPTGITVENTTLRVLTSAQAPDGMMKVEYHFVESDKHKDYVEVLYIPKLNAEPDWIIPLKKRIMFTNLKTV